MGLKVTNNAFGTLNAGINSSATTIVLTAGQGARFPTLSAGDYFYATLIDTSNNLEIVKVTARSTDTMTVVRGQDNTTARAYSTNDRFELRPTAVMFTETIDKADAALPKAGGTVTGRLTVSVATGHQLTLAQWGDASSADGGQTMVAGNAYFDKSSGAAKFSNSHGTIGATGIRFNSPSWNEGSLFTAGVTGSTAGNTFTPVDALLWDTAGRVRMPYQPGFGGYRGENRTADGKFQNYTTMAGSFNRGSHFNASTGTFTAPISGVYLVGATVNSNHNGQSRGLMRLFINSTQYAEITESWGSYQDVGSANLVALNANDTMHLTIEGATGSTPYQCIFSAILMG